MPFCPILRHVLALIACYQPAGASRLAQKFIGQKKSINFGYKVLSKSWKRINFTFQTDKFYISEVAHMCGFNSLKYFGRCFRKEFGISPSEYSKKGAE